MIEYKKYLFEIKNGEVEAPRELHEFLLTKIDKSRYEHSLRVAQLAYEIAISNQLEEPIKYYFTGFIHDCAKKMPLDEQKLYIKSHFPMYLDYPSYAFHAFASLKVVKDELAVEDVEILDALMYHCTGNANLNDLALVLYASDKIEPGRSYDSSDLIREMKLDYKKGFIKVVEACKEYIDARHSKQNKLTDNMYEYYLKGENMKIEKVIEKAIKDKKGENIIIYDVTGKNPLCDYVIIATALNERNLESIADNVVDELEKHKFKINHVEGKSNTPWIIVDAIDAICHILTAEERERIKLEDLLEWQIRSNN